MILAAGIGRRLKEVTQSTPKALVEVGGKPILGRIIENLISAGVTEIVINLHYLSEQIKDYIAQEKFSAKFFFSEEEELLDTGGALKQAAQFFKSDENFILHNCDIYTNFDLKKIIRAHSSLVTSLISPKTSERFLWFDRSNCLVGCENAITGYQNIVKNNPPHAPYNYNCINIINTKLFRYFDLLPEKFGLFDLFLTAVKQGEFISGFEMQGEYWIDIGTPEDLKEARRKVT